MSEVLEIMTAEQFVVELAATEGWIDHGRLREPDFGTSTTAATPAPAVPLVSRGDWI